MFCQSLLPICTSYRSQVWLLILVLWITLLRFHTLLFPFYHRSIKIETMIIYFFKNKNEKDERATSADR